MRQVFPHHGHSMEGLGFHSHLRTGTLGWERTSLDSCVYASGCVLEYLIRTFRLPRVLSDVDPEAGGRLTSPEKVHDFGSTFLIPDILLSSCSNSGNTVFVGSEIPARTYTRFEHRTKKRKLEIDIIQESDEPRQILVFQVWENVSILVSMKDVDKMFVKLVVEVAESLQRIWCDHRDAFSGEATTCEVEWKGHSRGPTEKQ